MKTFHHLCRLWDSTLTVFCSDNGGKPVYGGYNWPLRGTKQTLWEGGVRSTGFVHGKILERKGAKCDGLLHISDFFPTLINLAGKFNLFCPMICKEVVQEGFFFWWALTSCFRLEQSEHTRETHGRDTRARLIRTDFCFCNKLRVRTFLYNRAQAFAWATCVICLFSWEIIVVILFGFVIRWYIWSTKSHPSWRLWCVEHHISWRSVSSHRDLA